MVSDCAKARGSFPPKGQRQAGPGSEDTGKWYPFQGSGAGGYGQQPRCIQARWRRALDRGKPPRLGLVESRQGTGR
eukprot:3916532-Pleurochrysis_carterae.AAC.1